VRISQGTIDWILVMIQNFLEKKIITIAIHINSQEQKMKILGGGLSSLNAFYTVSQKSTPPSFCHNFAKY